MQLFYQENITPPYITLGSEESRHLIKVLRKKTGDTVEVTDGHGNLYHCQITALENKEVQLEIKNQEVQNKPKHHIHLAIAPTKNSDRMEWMIEKATEIGFDEITLIETENSERSRLKIDRLKRKIISACKQSLKCHFPQIHQLEDFKSFLDKSVNLKAEKFIAYVDKNHRNHLINAASASKNYLVLIGPEGDFNTSEIRLAMDKDFIPVSLGLSRLRTETAGLAAIHILQLIREQE